MMAPSDITLSRGSFERLFIMPGYDSSSRGDLGEDGIVGKTREMRR